MGVPHGLFTGSCRGTKSFFTPASGNGLSGRALMWIKLLASVKETADRLIV